MIWQKVARQGPFWPPAWDFSVVLVLSAVLGTWPLLDPKWSHRWLYSFIVLALMLTACLLSARDRWRLEERYKLQIGSLVARLQSRIWEALTSLLDILEREEMASAPPEAIHAIVAREFGNRYITVLALLNELAEYDVLADRKLKAIIDKGVKTPEDLIVVIKSLQAMAVELGRLGRATP
jgi:hypothetical protein